MKPWAYVVLFSMLIAGLGGIYAKGHSAGYDKRDKTVAQEIQDAVQVERKAQEEAWQKVVEAAEAQVIVEEKIVEVIREVEIKIPEVVDRIIVKKPECRDLGDEYGGLLDQQVAAANGREAPADPAELAAGVPGITNLLLGPNRPHSYRAWAEYGDFGNLPGAT